MEKDIFENTNHTVRVTILIPGEIELRRRNITMPKEEHFIK